MEGNGNSPKEPLVYSPDGTSQVLHYGGQSGARNATVSINPETGRATVTFVIYYASENHQIKYNETITVGGNMGSATLNATSEKFAVLAGPPSSLEIVADGKRFDEDGRLVLSFVNDGEVILRARTWDEYGNLVGDYPSDWKCTSEPDVPCVSGNGVSVVVYNPKTAEANGEANVCAEAVVGGVLLSNCKTIEIKDVTIYASSITTRDPDGCGYIDLLEVKFRKPVSMVASPTYSSIEVFFRYGTEPVTNFAVSRAEMVSADSALVYLTENQTARLQTGWKPTVIIRDGVFEGAGGGQQHIALDGAAPVIDKAGVTTSAQNGNRLRVRFSENVRTSNRVSFRQDSREYRPDELFNIWVAKGPAKSRSLFKSKRLLAKAAHDPNSGLTFELDDKILGNITGMVIEDDSTVIFNLGKVELLYGGGTGKHYINIKTPPYGSEVHVLDVPFNVPTDKNRKVPIMWDGGDKEQARAVPNPASPDPNRKSSNGVELKPGFIEARHDANAIAEIRGNTAGGTVLQVPVYVPNTGTMMCQIKVYDLAGNLVASGQSDGDAAVGLTRGGDAKLDLYWNGYNSKQMKVAPGTYRMVVYVSYKNINRNDPTDAQRAKPTKHQGVVGMGK
jgi:hypothetical protein